MGNLSVPDAIRELYIALTALLFNLVFLAFLEAQGYRYMRSKRAFRNYTLMVAVAHLVSCVDMFFFISVIGIPPVVRICATIAVTMTNQLMALYFSIFFVRFFARLEQKDYDVPIFNYGVAAVKGLLFVMWAVWSIPYVLRTGEGSNLPAVLEYVAGYGLNLYHICWCLVFFLRKRKILRRRIRYAAVFGFVVVVSTIVLQTVIGYVPHFYYLGPTIALMIFYFFMESKPASEIVTTGYERPWTGSEDAAPPSTAPAPASPESAAPHPATEQEAATVAQPEESAAPPSPAPASPESAAPRPATEQEAATVAQPEESAAPPSPAPVSPESAAPSAAPAAPAPVSADDILPEPDESVTKEEAVRRVRAALPEVLASYRALSEVFSPYFGTPEEAAASDDDLPEIGQEDLDELYDAVREFASIYDQDAILRLLEQMKGYTVPEAEKERYAAMKELVISSDWNGLTSLLQ